MKKMIVLSALLISSASFAGTTFVSEASESLDIQAVCPALAGTKLVNYAIENGVTITEKDLSTIRVIGSDLRKLNPSHYSWYELDVKINGEVKTIRTLVQKNRITGNCL